MAEPTPLSDGRQRLLLVTGLAGAGKSTALDVLEDADGPRTTVHSPLVWPGEGAWKVDYANADRLSAEEIAERRRKFDEGRAVAKGLRES